MAEIVGIRFKQAGTVYYFDSAGIELEVGDMVVAETARGPALGKVVSKPSEAAESEEQLKPVLRQAQPEDMEQLDDIKEKEKEAFTACEELVAKYRLPMKLLAVEYEFGGDHLTIYFRAEERVDFRALLRELSSILKTRVELRQLGTRDAAKKVGGLGRCGRELCCTSYLTKFDPISMKMAKEQNLPLNPLKISGVCGRLLCCLSYENDQYRLMKQKMPSVGQKVTTPHGEAKVIVSNPLKETVIVQFESEATLELPLSELGSPDNS